MTIIEVLKVQHNVILRQLEYLEKLRSSAQRNSESCCLKQVLLCIVDTVNAHAKIEEKYLFPELEPYVGKEMSSPAVMKFEHAEILGILATLRKTDAAEVVWLETAKFIIFLKDHIDKEEKVLFPTAEKALGQKRLEELLQKSGVFQRKNAGH